MLEAEAIAGIADVFAVVIVQRQRLAEESAEAETGPCGRCESPGEGVAEGISRSEAAVERGHHVGFGGEGGGADEGLPPDGIEDAETGANDRFREDAVGEADACAEELQVWRDPSSRSLCGVL